jgi:ParB family chromosome partitioning protein
LTDTEVRPNRSARTVPIATVAVGERDREELGDIDALARSIQAVGLLHPVVVTEALTLVAGDRRLAAVRQLGWAEVPVTVVDLATAADVLRAEADENTERKPLTPFEASRARQRRSAVLAEDAKQRQRNHGQTAPGRTKAQEDTSANLAEVKAEQKVAPVAESRTGRETRKVAASGTGYSGSTLDKVDEIREIVERGVVKVGHGPTRREVPAPPPVRAAAEKGLADLKRTSAAVEPAVKAVRREIEEHLKPDADELAARYLKDFVFALAEVRKVYADFDAERVAGLIDVAVSESLARHATSLGDFAHRVSRARSGLRVVNGGKA